MSYDDVTVCCDLCENELSLTDHETWCAPCAQGWRDQHNQLGSDCVSLLRMLRGAAPFSATFLEGVEQRLVEAEFMRKAGP